MAPKPRFPFRRARGYDAQIVCRDADDVLKLEQGAEE